MEMPRKPLRYAYKAERFLPYYTNGEETHATELNQSVINWGRNTNQQLQILKYLEKTNILEENKT